MTIKGPGWIGMLFLLGGVVVVALGVTGNFLLEIGTQVLAVGFLAAALLARRSPRFRGVWEILFAFFIFAFTFFTRFVAVLLVGRFVSASTVPGEIALSCTLFASVIATILLLTKAAGWSLSSLYVQRGNLRLGLLAGGLALVVLYVGILAGYLLYFHGTDGVTLGRLLSLTPLVLVLSAFNAPNEELWFRGLFLKRWEPHVGKRWANLLQAPAFVLAHYVPEFTRFGDGFVAGFLLVAFAAALSVGYLMQRTDSLLGPTLAHIGADVAIFMAVVLGLTSSGLGT
jgi:membrane protease YdiL (CAAX protease family)